MRQIIELKISLLRNSGIILVMKKDRKLKVANDYPLFGYRMMPDAKTDLEDLMNDLYKLYNRSVPKGVRKFKKNELFEKALRIGVAELKRRKA